MCGIAGIMNLETGRMPTYEEITAMMSPVIHRGPDESGVFLDDQIALGHLRLSIIGLDDGVQPLCNESGTLWIVYNGETFNYIELKEELLAKGHQFRTSTDTEVVLHLYEEYGTGCLQRINGQFALAIWDSAKQELFLARDRIGIRPLYYARIDGRLLFASEMKSIFAIEGSRELDFISLFQIFVLWTTLPGRTVFKGIHELPPAHWMLVRDGEMKTERYWNILFPTPEAVPRLSFMEAVEELRALLKDAVRLRLRADVPVGAYLSGGLDSSIISTLIARDFRNPLKTFSVGFRDENFDESQYQQKLVDFLGSDHRQILIGNEDIRKCLAETIWHCETPILRTAPVPLYILSDLVRSEGRKVALSGEGADEVLGGYDIFKEAKVRSYWAKQPTSLRRPLLLERLYPYIFRNPSRGREFLHRFFAAKPEQLADPFFSHSIRWENGRKNTTFLSDEVRAALSGYDPLDELAQRLPESFGDRDMVSKAQVLEMEIFLGNYLLSSQGDRVAMAHSVELRHPFLDFRVIDFAFGLPAKWKIHSLNEKYILKRAFEEALPKGIICRSKQPYRAPIRQIFANGIGDDYLRQMVSEKALKKSGYFDSAKVLRLLAKFWHDSTSPANEFQNMALIGVLSTQMVHHQFVEQFSSRTRRCVSPTKVIRGQTRQSELKRTVKHAQDHVMAAST